MKTIRVIARLVMLALVSPIAATTVLAAGQPQAPKTIRWVLAHTNEDAAYAPLFAAFARRVEERSDGQLKIEFIADVLESNRERAGERMLLEGAADMAQLEKGLAQQLPAVTAPFAFRGYAHAEAVFNDPVGKKLLGEIYASTDQKLRALAFTYSGGQRVFFGASPIKTLADFKGQRMQSPGTSGWTFLMDELMMTVGVRLVAPIPIGTPSLEAADQFESVINRGPREIASLPVESKKLKYINRTNHSLLVTTILANEKFFAGLKADHRRLLTEEIEALALEERKLSIDLEPKRLEELTKLGMQVVDLPPSERKKLIALGDSVLKKHPAIYRAVQEIRSVKESAQTAQR